MDRMNLAQSLCYPTYTTTTSSGFTLTSIERDNKTANCTLVVVDEEVYDLTEWVLETSGEREEIKDLAEEDVLRAGEAWAGLVGDDKELYRVGRVVAEPAFVEVEEDTQECGPSSIAGGESFVPSRSGSPAGPYPTGDANPGYAHSHQAPDAVASSASTHPGLSHLEYALALLDQRQRRLLWARRNEHLARTEVATAEQEVRDAERLRDGLVLMAMEGEKPRWSAWRN